MIPKIIFMVIKFNQLYMQPLQDRKQNMIDLLFEEYGHTLIVGHRGYAKGMDFHRNTLPAFEYAIESGAHGIECDLRLTNDGEVVVHHNPWVRNGFSIQRISTSTYDELVAVKESEANIPRIDDIIKILPENMLFFIQIKDPDTVIPILDHLRQIVKKPEQIMIMGYMHEILNRELPEIFTYGKHYLNPTDKNLQYIFDRRNEGINIDLASPMWNWLTDSHIDKIHELNLQSVVFTTNPTDALRWLINKKVNVIYTDSVKKALELV